MSKIKLMIEMDEETYNLTRSRIGYWLSNLLNRRTAFPYRLYLEFYEDKRIEECDDAVSRQAVLDIAKSSKSNWIDNSVLFKRVNELPSIAPKREQGEYDEDYKTLQIKLENAEDVIENLKEDLRQAREDLRYAEMR